MAANFSSNHFNVSRFVLALGFIVVAYMMYILTASIYNSYMLDRHISQFKQKNQEIAKEYQTNLDNLKYFESDAYAEKIAKEQLGMVNRGEEVIILLNENVISKQEQDKIEAEELLDYRRRTNPSKWWYYFFS